MNLILATLAPLVTFGGPLTSWLVSLVILAVIVCFVVWATTKCFGPPQPPREWSWIVWLIVGLALLWFIFAALGLPLP